mgnify:FL=1
MTNLIYKLSSKEEKYKIYMQLKENDMFLEKPKVDMETAYGLHYPGEVLERIGEHLTLTKQTYRALGLALARMMPLQETCMFNGTQKDLFWKKMKQILGEKDLFLISINYICEEKEKNRWKQAMHAYPFERAEEMLFAMSILPDDETLWEGIKQKLADSAYIPCYLGCGCFHFISYIVNNQIKNKYETDTATTLRNNARSRYCLFPAFG